MTKLLIIEDHRLVAEGLAIGLGSEGYAVLISPGDPGIVRRDVLEFDPDVVLLDLGLGHHGSGLDLLPELVRPGRYVVVLTGETDPRILGESFDKGATAVLDKAIPFPSLIAELREVTEGGTAAAEKKRRQLQMERRRLDTRAAQRLQPFEDLTPREEEVLGMLVDGRAAAEIAELSFVSLSTVRTQIRGILTKLGVSSQLAAVSMAVKSGWTPGGR